MGGSQKATPSSSSSQRRRMRPGEAVGQRCSHLSAGCPAPGRLPPTAPRPQPLWPDPRSRSRDCLRAEPPRVGAPRFLSSPTFLSGCGQDQWETSLQGPTCTGRASPMTPQPTARESPQLGPPPRSTRGGHWERGLVSGGDCLTHGRTCDPVLLPESAREAGPWGDRDTGAANSPWPGFRATSCPHTVP